MRWLLVLGFLLLWMSAEFTVLAQPAPNESVVYITSYQDAETHQTVYGVFDLGERPSVRVLNPLKGAGRFLLRLHGKYFTGPVANAFAMKLRFEDVTGRVFNESPGEIFLLNKQPSSPHWFAELTHIAGYYGQQEITFSVPYGTTVLNILGDDTTQATSPNQLLGYVSHFEFFSDP